MAIPRKGTRKIVVENTSYVFKVSKPRKKSDWRVQKNELDKTFMNYARHYGLGNVKDVTFGIVIQLLDNPVSSIFIKYHSILVDGFLGSEQLTQIQPNFISYIITKAINDGWNPSKKGNFRLNIAEQNTNEKKHVILLLPNMNEGPENYENLDKPVEIVLIRDSGKL